MKKLFSFLLSIFKGLGRGITFIRNLVLNIFFLCIILFVLVALFSNEDVGIVDHTGLLLSIKGNIVEEKQLADPLSDIIDSSVGVSRISQETLLPDIIDAINAAANDSRISAIILDMHLMGNSSLDQLKDIGEALQQFKLTGKRVVAAEDSYTQAKYFLASYADEVLLNPTGLVDLHGLAAYTLYFKDALDKLKVNYHIFRVGKYKSAVEPLTRNSMSEEAKSQNQQWLSALWNEYTDSICRNRKISGSVIARYTNSPASLMREMDGDAAAIALESGLVDALMTRAEVRTHLASLTAPAQKKGFRSISLQSYLGTIDRSYTRTPSQNSAVGIIVASGNIVPGDQPPGNIGSETLTRLIREARLDPKIKAIVLRIKSGGGSVVASELIRTELQQLKNSGKPFVVSMGGMAASGGYWISAEADEIWAYPTTLTGSIGIFGAVPTFEETLSNFGVHGDGVGTTAMSTSRNLTEPMSDEMKEIVQLSIEHGYRQFLDIVMKGRGITAQQVDLLAEGRVFDGRTAMELGLVDKLGNLQDATSAAASLAGLNNYDVTYIRNTETFADKLLGRLQQGLVAQAILTHLPPAITELLRHSDNAKALASFLQDPRGIYAHCLIDSM